MNVLDLAIRGATIHDGSGAPARRGDVGIAGDRIESVGDDLSAAETRATLDAGGCVVCPGFVDAHSHSDTFLLIEPSAPSKVFQGITTEVVGNCGASAAPRVGRYRPPSDWAEQAYPRAWRTVAEYREVLALARPATNVRLLAGHNTIRGSVMGYDGRPATPDELAGMERLLEQAWDEGARGFSTGLIYPPGLFAGADEVTRLAAVVGRRGGVYASHLRSEGATLLEALDEFLAAGRASGARLQISHLKTSGSENWGKLDAAFERIRRARENGAIVAADRYPYTAGWTDLDVVLPTWAKAGGRDAILARLRDAETRRRLRDELLASRPAEAWAGVILGSVKVAPWRDLQGLPVPDAARRLGLDCVDAVLTVLDRDELRTGAFFAGMSEANMFRILADPNVMLGTDASIRSTTGPLSRDYPHPRAYGCVPRFLRLALDGRTVPLAEAIRKMTALPAEHFGLADRGTLRRGLKADVTVFDPVRVRDTSDYARPHSLAEGVRHVVVNGVAVLADGVLTGQRSGRFLE